MNPQRPSTHPLFVDRPVHENPAGDSARPSDVLLPEEPSSLLEVVFHFVLVFCVVGSLLTCALRLATLPGAGGDRIQPAAPASSESLAQVSPSPSVSPRPSNAGEARPL